MRSVLIASRATSFVREGVVAVATVLTAKGADDGRYHRADTVSFQSGSLS